VLNHLLGRKFRETDLPPIPKITGWLKNAKTSLKREQPLNISSVGPMAVEVQMRSLQTWIEQEAKHGHTLVVAKIPAPVLQERMCVVFNCQDMDDMIGRYEQPELALLVDVKQGCMAHGYGVATLSVLGKDKLRNTTLGRFQGKKVQCLAHTSHANPWLQAIFNSENIENFVQLFQTAERRWASIHPTRPTLCDSVVQVHKDYAPAIEEARLQRFRKSRPVNNYFHFTEHGKTLEAKLTQMTLQNGKYVKTELEWTKAGRRCLRHLVTFDLYSLLWAGFLEQIRLKKNLWRQII